LGALDRSRERYRNRVAPVAIVTLIFANGTRPRGVHSACITCSNTRRGSGCRLFFQLVSRGRANATRGVRNLIIVHYPYSVGAISSNDRGNEPWDERVRARLCDSNYK